RKQTNREAWGVGGGLDPQGNSRPKERMTLFCKAKAFGAGEKVSFEVKDYPPLYTPKNGTLINLFRITVDEQRQLKTIISSEMALERDRRRDEVRRRAAGAVDRKTYLEAANAKLAKAQALRAEGMSVRAIAKKMGISVGSVSGYLKAQPLDCSESVRITNG
ncbi:replication protein, partial [Corynebacterium pseudodiphtheriticum]